MCDDNSASLCKLSPVKFSTHPYHLPFEQTILVHHRVVGGDGGHVTSHGARPQLIRRRPVPGLCVSACPIINIVTLLLLLYYYYHCYYYCYCYCSFFKLINCIFIVFYFIFRFLNKNLIFSCYGMFRDIPECSGMFYVPGFIDGPDVLHRFTSDATSWAVDKTRNMEHSGTFRNILEYPGTSRNIKVYLTPNFLFAKLKYPC